MKTFQKLLLGVVVLSALPLRAEAKWIRIHSPNFEVLSSASEKETKETLQYFEQVRAFFLGLNGRAPANPVPVFIVIFGSEKEYQPYRPNEATIAYYMPSRDRDYIVMGRTGLDAEHIATHEYTHLVADHAGLEYPPWLNEGLAEMFATFAENKGEITIGDPIPGRVSALRSGFWSPLSAIMAADHDSPYYNEASKMGSLYNQGWAAVHLLSTSKEYRPKFPQFLAAVQTGMSSIEALQKVYGKSLAAFETELRGYVQQDQFYRLAGKLTIDKAKKAPPVETAPAFDVKLALIDLAVRKGGETETRRKLEELSREDLKRPEPWAGLAYLDWSQGNAVSAVENFSKAYALGARGNRLLWDFGRLAEGPRPEESIRALSDLLALDPGRNEVRIELAWSQINLRKTADAAKTLAGLANATPEEAPRAFMAMAYVQLQAGNSSAALAAIENLKRWAKTDSDRAEAARLQRIAERSGAAPDRGPVAGISSSASITTSTDDELRPILRRVPGPQPSGVFSQPPVLVSVSGVFSEFVCLDNGKGYRVVVDTGAGKKSFGFIEPGAISIVGVPGGKIDLQCGPQKGDRVKVDYSEADARDVDGLLSILTFEK